MFLCQDTIDAQDCRYSDDINNSDMIMDVSSYGSQSTHMYYSWGVGRYSRNISFCVVVGKGEDLLYCIDTKKSSHCFGCVNMKDKEYCIFDKQYSKEEWEMLVPQLIEKMEADGLWGRFFPPASSPSPLNDTVAYEYFPVKTLI